MNDHSPPKRVTRARAAAQLDTGVKIATAASKAKLTKRNNNVVDLNEGKERNTTESELPKRTRARAKRAADVHDESPNETTDELVKLPKTTRGRAQKTAEETTNEHNLEAIDPKLPENTTRGRAKKATVKRPDPEPEMQEDSTPAKPTRGRPKKIVEAPRPTEPARSTRGRAREVQRPEEEFVVVVEELKKPIRNRVTTAPKKTVKFEESDKENIVPPTANGVEGEAKATAGVKGLKAKPVRKAATTASRATRGRAKVDEKQQKSSPLSPKKATQVATAKEQASDDELALNEKTPMKPLMRSPVRAPGSNNGTAKKLGFSNSFSIHTAVGQDLSASIMASPARRPPQSPFKDSLKTSAEGADFAGSLMKSPFKLALPQSKLIDPTSSTNFKASLLQSPARRPQSPTKVSEHGSPSRYSTTNPMISGVTPKINTFKISRFATPRTITKNAAPPAQMLSPSAIKRTATNKEHGKDEPPESAEIASSSLNFSGRLSSVASRDVDSANISEYIVKDTGAQPTIEVEQAGEPMIVNEAEGIHEMATNDHILCRSCSPSRSNTGAFALRVEDVNPFVDTDSEDELASTSPKYSPNLFASSPSTPTPLTALNKTRKPQESSLKERRSRVGFTPLARQLSDWMASSPEKTDQGSSDEEVTSPTSTPQIDLLNEVENIAQASPVRSTFFDDEMSVRDEMQSAPKPAEDAVDGQYFTPIEVIAEDLALAEEADEMSLVEVDGINKRGEIEHEMKMLLNSEEAATDSIPPDVRQVTHDFIATNRTYLESMQVENKDDSDEHSLSTKEPAMQLPKGSATEQADVQNDIENTDDSALSEASQEYADENAIPIDPALLVLSAAHTLAIPTFRVAKSILAERICHTVSKVPLKAPAEDTPTRPSLVKRSASVSRIPAPRPSSNLLRSNSVISYSPSKSTRMTRPQLQQEGTDFIMKEAHATPLSPDTATWSNMGTPARTPRRDIDTALLKGAVVLVDVHTSEGADASSLFTELLTQMGARCVKTWNWNPSSVDGSKIGITHVVFKDGGKRTLEKAKETGGVVTCVGVGWVLE